MEAECEEEAAPFFEGAGFLRAGDFFLVTDLKTRKRCNIATFLKKTSPDIYFFVPRYKISRVVRSVAPYV